MFDNQLLIVVNRDPWRFINTAGPFSVQKGEQVVAHD